MKKQDKWMYFYLNFINVYIKYIKAKTKEIKQHGNSNYLWVLKL